MAHVDFDLKSVKLSEDWCLKGNVSDVINSKFSPLHCNSESSTKEYEEKRNSVQKVFSLLGWGSCGLQRCAPSYASHISSNQGCPIIATSPQSYNPIGVSHIRWEPQHSYEGITLLWIWHSWTQSSVVTEKRDYWPLQLPSKPRQVRRLRQSFLGSRFLLE